MMVKYRKDKFSGIPPLYGRNCRETVWQNPYNDVMEVRRWTGYNI